METIRAVNYEIDEYECRLKDQYAEMDSIKQNKRYDGASEPWIGLVKAQQAAIDRLYTMIYQLREEKATLLRIASSTLLEYTGSTDNVYYPDIPAAR